MPPCSTVRADGWSFATAGFPGGRSGPPPALSRSGSRGYEIYLARTRKDAEEAFDAFLKLYQAKYPKACNCLSKDREVMMTFYDFPA